MGVGSSFRRIHALNSTRGKLGEEGYVEKGKIDRRTNFYAITDVGRNVIRDRREWEDFSACYFDCG